MALAICNDRICSGRMELSYNWENTFTFFFSLDSIFSTNGCIGTRFMDVAVRMHKLETKWGTYFMRLGVDTDKKTQYHWFKHIFNMP